MEHFFLRIIRFYQKYISPYKGFCCAYRCYTGHASCSDLGYRAIRHYGIRRGIGVLRQRLVKCGVAYRRFSAVTRSLDKQAGHCDLPCDIPADLSCDLSACDLHGHQVGSAVCDILSNCTPCDCGDWPGSRRKRNKEDSLYLPPNRK